jgi:hypothetical protein
MTPAHARRALAAALSTAALLVLPAPASAQQARQGAVTFARNHDRSNIPPVRGHDRSNLPPVARNHDRSNLPPWWPTPRNHDRSNLPPTRDHDRLNPAAASAGAPGSDLVELLTSRGNLAARPHAEALVDALAELPEHPERLATAVDAFNSLVDASTPAFLRAPPTEFLVIRSTLARFAAEEAPAGLAAAQR